MPLINPRLGGARKTRGAAPARTVSREVARKVPLGRVTSPTQHDPRQALQQRINQLGTGFVPGPGRPAPTVRTGLYIPTAADIASGKYKLPQRAGAAEQQKLKKFLERGAPVLRAGVGAGGTPTKSKTGGGVSSKKPSRTTSPQPQAGKLGSTGGSRRKATGGGIARRLPTGVQQRARRQFGIDPRRDVFGGRRFGPARSARTLLATGRLGAGSR